jgi:hypothetical protein
MRLPKWSQVKAALPGFATALSLVSTGEARMWNEHTSQLSQKARQLEMAEHEMHGLIEQKRHTDDPEQVGEIMRAIAERHRALEKKAKEYEEERQHVRFEHPERNDQLERKYVRHEVKSVEEMESTMGVDARLDRVRALVTFKFPVPEKKVTIEEKNFRTRLPASKKEIAEEDAPEKIRLVK